MARTHLTETVSADLTDEAVSPFAEAVEPSTEAVAEVPAEKTAEELQKEAEAAELQVKIDETVGEFKVAADAAIELRDDEGHLNPDQLSPVVIAYRKIEGGAKGKAAAKTHVIASLKAALTSGKSGYQVARAWNLIQDAIATAPTKGTGEGKPKATPVSETELFVDKVTALQLALSIVQDAVPEGVDANWEDKVDEKITESEESLRALYAYAVDAEATGDAPEASAVVKQAVKLAVARGPRKGKSASGEGGPAYGGPRRDVAAHILNAFADKEPGTFLTVNEIKSVPSEEYGADSPSPGAISARLFPKSGNLSAALAEVLEPGENDKGTNGATKK